TVHNTVHITLFTHRGPTINGDLNDLVCDIITNLEISDNVEIYRNSIVIKGSLNDDFSVNL
ncbi:hypothetical protein SLEP1_g60461, partial [Rubroshorea leprosula]